MRSKLDSKYVIKVLKPHLTDQRIERLEAAASNRTRSVTAVLEKPYDGGNINAAMRSSEAFGFQDFHIIEGPRRLRPTGRTSAGAGKWLSIHKWQSTKKCIDNLKNNNYLVLGTSAESDQSIKDIDFKKNTAVVFGSEHGGLSSEAEKLVDETISIPIVGMVESFNLSVAVALTLQTAFFNRGDSHSDMSEKEKLDLLAEYYIKSVPNSKKILNLS